MSASLVARPLIRYKSRFVTSFSASSSPVSPLISCSAPSLLFSSSSFSSSTLSAPSRSFRSAFGVSSRFRTGGVITAVGAGTLASSYFLYPTVRLHTDSSVPSQSSSSSSPSSTSSSSSSSSTSPSRALWSPPPYDPATSPNPFNSWDTKAPAPPPTDDPSARYPSLSSFLSSSTIILYQYQTCPFCNKVRAFLDYSRIPYTIVEVNPLTKKEIKWSAVKTFPILTIDGVQYNDSEVIISEMDKLVERLKQKENSSNSSSSSSSSSSAALSLPPRRNSSPDELSWRRWANDNICCLLVPNLYPNLPESFESMSYIRDQSAFSPFMRVCVARVGAMVMLFVGRQTLKKYSLEGFDPRQELYRSCNRWIDEGLKGQPFRGGAEPDLSDVTAFGLFRSLQGFASGRDMMNAANTSQNFVDYYRRMEKRVGPSMAKSPVNTRFAA